MDISYFLTNVEKWAKDNADIRGVVLVGSYAVEKARADSDIDLVIITRNPDVYINGYFIESFGRVMRFQKENRGKVTTIRVWYENNALEVEFSITTPLWLEKPLDSATLRVLSEGYKVVVDKEDYFKVV